MRNPFWIGKFDAVLPDLENHLKERLTGKDELRFDHYFDHFRVLENAKGQVIVEHGGKGEAVVDLDDNTVRALVAAISDEEKRTGP